MAEILRAALALAVDDQSIAESPVRVASAFTSGKPFTNIDRPWCKVRQRAVLKDVRMHDLRHPFASRALTLGERLPMIGKFLGHTRVQTTARYAHLAEESVLESGQCH